MSEVAPITPEEFESMTTQVRMHNTAKYREVLAALEPYVDGSVGMISPPHVKLYLAALKDLGALYRVSEPPRPVEGGDEVEVAQVRLAARQAEVLGQLEVLAAKARSRGLGA